MLKVIILISLLMLPLFLSMIFSYSLNGYVGISNMTKKRYLVKFHKVIAKFVILFVPNMVPKHSDLIITDFSFLKISLWPMPLNHATSLKVGNCVIDAISIAPKSLQTQAAMSRNMLRAILAYRLYCRLRSLERFTFLAGVRLLVARILSKVICVSLLRSDVLLILRSLPLLSWESVLFKCHIRLSYSDIGCPNHSSRLAYLVTSFIRYLLIQVNTFYAEDSDTGTIDVSRYALETELNK